MNCEGLIQKILNYHANSKQKYGRGNSHPFMNKFPKNKTNEMKKNKKQIHKKKITSKINIFQDAQG